MKMVSLISMVQTDKSGIRLKLVTNLRCENWWQPLLQTHATPTIPCDKLSAVFAKQTVQKAVHSLNHQH